MKRRPKSTLTRKKDRKTTTINVGQALIPKIFPDATFHRFVRLAPYVKDVVLLEFFHDLVNKLVISHQAVAGRSQQKPIQGCQSALCQ